MSELKPSSNEEEYFHKLEREKAARRKAESEQARAAEALEARKAAHWMRCPKCGAELATETYHRIQVDRCTECKGIWFDAGEAESLLDKDEGAVTRFFGDMLGGLGGKKRS
jgi:hypothetical protein